MQSDQPESFFPSTYPKCQRWRGPYGAQLPDAKMSKGSQNVCYGLLNHTSFLVMCRKLAEREAIENRTAYRRCISALHIALSCGQNRNGAHPRFKEFAKKDKVV